MTHEARFTPTVYMLASRRNGTLYAGVTSIPLSRWHQHRTDQVRGFTSDYGVKMLVWSEFCWVPAFAGMTKGSDSAQFSLWVESRRYPNRRSARRASLLNTSRQSTDPREHRKRDPVGQRHSVWPHKAYEQKDEPARENGNAQEIKSAEEQKSSLWSGHRTENTPLANVRNGSKARGSALAKSKAPDRLPARASPAAGARRVSIVWRCG